MSGVATLKLRGSKRHFDEMAVDLPVPPQACSPSRYPFRPPPLKRGRCVTPSALSTPLRHSNTLATNNTITPISKQQLFNQFNSSTSSPSTSSSPTPSSSSPLKDNNRILITNTNINNNNNTNNSSNSNNNLNSKNNSNNTSQPSSSTQQASEQKGEEEEQQENLKSSKQQQQQQQNVIDHSKSKVIVSADDLTALARHLPRRLKRVIERLATGQVYSNEKLFTLSDLREIVNSVINEHDITLKEQFTNTLNERLNEQFRDFTKFNEDYVSRQLRGTDVAYLS